MPYVRALRMTQDWVTQINNFSTVPIKSNPYFFVHAEWGFNFLACLVQENKKYKVSVYFSELFLIVPKAASNFSSSRLSFMAGFLNNLGGFQNNF
jgi:hypothetical protein